MLLPGPQCRPRSRKELPALNSLHQGNAVLATLSPTQSTTAPLPTLTPEPSSACSTTHSHHLVLFLGLVVVLDSVRQGLACHDGGLAKSRAPARPSPLHLCNLRI